MEWTRDQLDQAINTGEVIALATSLLMAKAHAEILTKKVDAVYLQILKDIPLYADDRGPEHRTGRSGQRIMDHNKMYLAYDDDGAPETCARIYAEADKRLKAAGIKPASMGDEFCPALIAESKVREIRRRLADAVGAPLGTGADDLLCSPDGLALYEKFTDLICGAVTKLPAFVDPRVFLNK